MKRTLIVVALAAALPLSALAQSTNPPAPGAPKSGPDTRDTSVPGESKGLTGKEKGPSLNTFDKNRDGYVSKEEAKSSRELSSRFGELDKDNDGKLSAQELSGASNNAGMSGSSSTTTGSGNAPKSKSNY